MSPAQKEMIGMYHIHGSMLLDVDDEGAISMIVAVCPELLERSKVSQVASHFLSSPCQPPGVALGAEFALAKGNSLRLDIVGVDRLIALT